MKTTQDHATDIVKKLKAAGYIAYFAGGWVRDYLMEHPSSDIDIATDAPPEKILDTFPRTILVGLAFGVVIVQIDGYQFEVSTFRKDIEYVNGRKPEKVELNSTPQEDASRRDFTINGMFYDPVEDMIYDFVHGVEDIKNGLIRTIGDPYERFVEDRLRMIRAVRFASRFGFIIDQETQEAIIENADTLFPAVAMERVLNEFNKMAQYPRFDLALTQMHRLKLLSVIFPQLESVHLKEIKHRLSGFPFFPSHTPTAAFLMELFPDASLEEKIDICLYLRMSAKEINLVQFLHEGKRVLGRDKEGIVADDEWVHFYADPRAQLCLQIEEAHLPEQEKSDFFHRHEERRQKLKVHVDRLIQKKPLVAAAHFLSMGITPGKIMGSLLKEAEKLTILHNLNTVEEVIKKMKSLPIWPEHV